MKPTLTHAPPNGRHPKPFTIRAYNDSYSTTRSGTTLDANGRMCMSEAHDVAQVATTPRFFRLLFPSLSLFFSLSCNSVSFCCQALLMMQATNAPPLPSCDDSWSRHNCAGPVRVGTRGPLINESQSVAATWENKSHVGTKSNFDVDYYLHRPFGKR